MSISVGDSAPNFSLPGTADKSYSLSEYSGKPVVLVFYPGDDTPVCTKQLNTYNDELSKFEQLEAQVLAISAQDVSSHEEFSGKHGFKFPLLADVNKEVAALYGTLGPLGFPRRSVFVVDPQGKIVYAHRALAGLTFRSVDDITTAIKKC